MKTLEELNLSPVVISVDIETADTAITSKICSIGAVAIDIETGHEVDHFYKRVEWQDSQYNRTENQDTLKWHSKLSTEASEELYAQSERENLPLALISFCSWVKGVSPDAKTQVFGNGCEFDNAILLHAMEQYHIKAPWHFAGNQSLRTVVWMGRVLLGIDPKYTMEKSDEFVAHHAFHDARHEAQYLYHIVNAIRENLKAQKHEVTAKA